MPFAAGGLASLVPGCPTGEIVRCNQAVVQQLVEQSPRANRLEGASTSAGCLLVDQFHHVGRPVVELASLAGCLILGAPLRRAFPQ